MSHTYGNVGAYSGGTLYLKRSYQRNLFLAELYLVLAIGLAIGITALVMAQTDKPQREIPTVVYDTANVSRPPVIKRYEYEVEKRVLPMLPDLSMIEAGEDSEILFDFKLATREDISRYNSSFDSDGDSIMVIGNPSLEIGEIIPSPDSFVAVDEHPQAIYFPPVRYPEIARKADIEGSVWLKVLVDVSGNVRDVVVAIPSKASAGFEEAAMAAARESKWRPAMQNKQPVLVWVSYEVRFKLK